jgi:hypothetical protein
MHPFPAPFTRKEFDAVLHLPKIPFEKPPGRSKYNRVKAMQFGEEAEQLRHTRQTSTL